MAAVKGVNKRDAQRRLKQMSEKEVKDLLSRIVFNAIRDGRKIGMTSVEILSTVCDLTEEAGLGR
jgi:hypothetical protein